MSLKKKLVFIIGLWASIWLAYGDSLTASWHLDDIPSIVRNEKIHLTRLNPDALIGTFFAGTEGKLYRPVPMASFALNWYLGGVNVVGYHIMNVGIHCLNALLLFLIVVQLLRTSRHSGDCTDPEIYWAAFLAAFFWALNPVQTQAVTYIVQRMASMAGMFYLLGIFLYLRYKNTTSTIPRISLLAGVVCSYLLAVLSKENAVLFPLGIFLIKNLTNGTDAWHRPKVKGWVISGVAFVCTMVAGGALLLLVRDNPLQFIENLYANRPFTCWQRLLTEPRVMLFYLSQLYFPVPSRISLSHDIVVSTSFFEPWTTIPSLFAVAVIIILCIVGFEKKPFTSFAFLFFFVNHGVESTILPLELVFEHRNYLPSSFLFLPLSMFLVRSFRGSVFASRPARYAVVGVVSIVAFTFCNWTFARNTVWHSEKTLWEDEIAKNPNLARPYHNLANGYYQPLGKYREALVLYEKALSKKYHSAFELAITQGNIGRIYYLLGEYEKALAFFSESIAKHPQPEVIKYQTIMTLIQIDRLPQALGLLDTALQNNGQDPLYLKLKGIVLSKNGDYGHAVSFFARSLRADPRKIDTRVHLAVTLSRLGRIDEARSILENKKTIRLNNPQVLMALAEIERVAGEPTKSEVYFNRIVENIGVEKVLDILLTWKKDRLAFEMDHDHYLSELTVTEP